MIIQNYFTSFGRITQISTQVPGDVRLRTGWGQATMLAMKFV